MTIDESELKRIEEAAREYVAKQGQREHRRAWSDVFIDGATAEHLHLKARHEAELKFRDKTIQEVTGNARQQITTLESQLKVANDNCDLAIFTLEAYRGDIKELESTIAALRKELEEARLPHYAPAFKRVEELKDRIANLEQMLVRADACISAETHQQFKDELMSLLNQETK